MTDEQRAAINRLRQGRYDLDNELGFAFQAADRRIVANLYLAEHPADDAEPVTEEWLRSVGFVEEDDHWLTRSGCSDARVTYYRLESPQFKAESCMASGFWLPHIKTSGDVRRLCRALGIPWDEGVRNDPTRSG